MWITCSQIGAIKPMQTLYWVKNPMRFSNNLHDFFIGITRKRKINENNCKNNLTRSNFSRIPFPVTRHQPKQNMKTLTPRQAFTKKIKMQDLTRARKQVENLAIALAPQYKAANDKFVFAQDNVMSLVITNKLTMRDCEGLVAKFEKFATA